MAWSGRCLVPGATLALLALPLLAGEAPAQLTDLQPGRNFTQSAQFGTSRSENIDAGDCDNDGDLDVIVANGGDGGIQANRIYINLGGLQAGTPGTFADESATRFAGVPNDKSRDCEFVDIDQDGDLDIHITNDGNASSLGSPSRFYQNQGGLQAGTIGYYAEITDTAYGTLVSVPPERQILGGNQGPFSDWSHDTDFADLDDDGDLDMFFSSHGPGMNGAIPSLVFLNDGTGVFNELWPWANPAADIQAHVVDLDLVDLDGDYDIDVVMSSRDSQARILVNNLYNPVGSAPFQDVTQQALLGSGAKQTGSNNYEVEYADVDGDGDFDLWMNNYNFNTERLLMNDGNLHKVPRFLQKDAWLVADPVVVEYEVDFGDFDGDGDLDAFLANFSGTNWLFQSGLAQGLDPDTQGLYHRNDGGFPASQAWGFPELPTNGNGQTSLDGEWSDLDGDGDLDILVANDGNGQNRHFTNALGVPDVHAPGFQGVDGPIGPPAGQDVVIHAAVRDNAPYYLHTLYTGRLVYSVDAGTPVTLPMVAQGSQQFRGVIPAQSGTVEWHVEVDDLAGNTGLSAGQAYVQNAVDPWTDLGSGLAGAGGVPSLVCIGSLVPGSVGSLTLSNAAPSATAFLFLSFASTPTPFKGGTLVPVPVTLTLPMFTDGTGGTPLAWASWPGGLPSGTTLYLQYAIADAGALAGTALSNALEGVTP
jgi:hypothetical protein